MTTSRRRQLVWTVGLAALAAAMSLLSVDLLLLALPALLIAALLVNGIFVGEDVLERISRARSVRRARPVRSISCDTTWLAWRPSAMLLAARLASRPPPAPVS